MSNVVITGLGACTGFASNTAQLWDQVSQGGTPEVSKKLKRFNFSAQRFAENAAREALQDAGLWDGSQIHDVDTSRFGCTVSVSKPLLQIPLAPFSKGGNPLNKLLPFPPLGLRRVRQRRSGGEKGGGEGFAVGSADVVNDELCRQFNIQGERRNVIAACATGAYSVALGASWIGQGLCDIVLAGSSEPRAHPLYEAGFRKMGVVSLEHTMRPFDKHRSGFVLSEGAGVVVLESKAHALKRGAMPHAILSGWGWGADTHSAVAFNSNGALIAQVIQRALDRAGLAPAQISHVNAHGTATRSNDWIETQALMKAFGAHAGKLMISGTKSSTGHLLGAAGSIELFLTVQALKHQFIPPTVHLEEPDAPLDYTPQRGHTATFEHALSLSFGFGGPIGALIVSQA